MKEQIEAIQTEALAQITLAGDERSLDDARVAVLGKKGTLTLAATGIKDVPKEDKAAVGQLLNAARANITTLLEEKQSTLREIADRAALAGIDVTLPARPLATRLNIDTCPCASAKSSVIASTGSSSSSIKTQVLLPRRPPRPRRDRNRDHRRARVAASAR